MSQLLQTAGRADKGVSLRYLFNGTDGYATMPAWSPLGNVFEVTASVRPLALPAFSNIVSDAAQNNRVYFQSSGQADSSVNAVASVLGAAVSVDTDHNFLHESLGSVEHRITVDSNPGSLVANAILSDPYTTIGGVAAANFMDGYIWNLAITDNNPIQDTDYVAGDGARTATFPNISLTGEFDISIDVRRSDVGTDITLLGNLADTTYVREQNSGTQIGVRIAGGTGSVVIPTLIANQHYTLRLVRDAVDLVTVYIDGNAEGTTTRAGNMDIEKIGGRGAGVQFSTGCGVQNLTINDITGAQNWNYPINEGSGTTLTETVQGNNGTWAPDASWVNQSNNSRLYPMDEGTGNTFVDTIGGNDATIQNFDEGNWSTP